MSWLPVDYARLRPRLLARGVPERLVPPPEPELAELERLAGEIIDARAERPDLVRESEQRSESAVAEAAHALGRSAPVTGAFKELPGTRHWPDPYGPDPVVFGSVPRVQSDA
jgi:hypothetical protein